MDGRTGLDDVSRRLKGFAWIQFDDIQIRSIEEMKLVVPKEVKRPFDDHADFRSWPDDCERIAFCFAAILHRMEEKNLRQPHVMVMMTVCDEQIVQITGGDAMAKHVRGGAEASVNQDVVID